MSDIPDTLRPMRVPLSDLRTYGANPRAGNVGVIAESLRVNGQYRPIVVNSRTNEILAGNHTYLAAQSLGWTELAATYVDADDEQAARIVLVDNRSNDLAGYDDAALTELLASVSDLAGTGYDTDSLERMLAAAAPPVDDVMPPDEFKSYDEDIETHFTCPRCAYSWSGNPGGGFKPAEESA